jgi:gliding motility-associated-like protein
MRIVIFLLINNICFLSYGQQPYNNCNSALELCPANTFSVSNIDANKTFCPGCEDDFSFCFNSNNSIWLKFTTNSIGGDVSVDFSNLVFETNPGQDNTIQATMLSASVPCNSASYTTIGNCVSNGTTSFSLTATGLPSNALYYIVISGDLSGAGISAAAECTMDVLINGTGVDRPVPSISITGSSTALCQNEIFSATASITDCPDNSTYNWYINGVLNAVTTNPVFQTSELLNGDIVSVETECFSLCSEFVTSALPAVSVYSFVVNAGSDITINSGETVQLNGTTSAPVFTWTPSYSISDVSSLSPFVYPTLTTTYTLTATENNCTQEDYVTIYIDEKLIFPTTFSPNGDDINDTWEISGVDQYPNCFVQIFDRWGQEVFQSIGYSKSKSWDGTGKTGKLAEGVYFYMVELRDPEKQEFKGSITLIR